METINPKEIAEQIAQKRNLAVSDILSKRRYSELVEARKEIIFALHDRGFSASAIGRFLGKTDHTSILFHLKGRVAKTNLASNK